MDNRRHSPEVSNAPTFVRAGLPALDVARAAQFYEDTFGWTFEPVHQHRRVRTGPPASVLRFAGRAAPGDDEWLEVAPEVELVGVSEAPTPGGVSVAIGTDSIDGAFGRIEQAGGRRIHGPDVIDDIRTAVFVDSEGNEIGLWSPGPEADFSWRPHHGASVVDGATFQYVQLPATDLQRAADFYGEVFGWAFTPPHESHTPGGPVPSAGQALYGWNVILYCNDARPEVGLLKVDRVASNSGIQIAIGVDSISSALGRIAAAGGNVNGRETELDGLAVASFADSEGNHVSLIAPTSGQRVPWIPQPLRPTPRM